MQRFFATPDRVSAVPKSSGPDSPPPGRPLDEPRVPPGQRVTRGFPILHVGAPPSFDPGTWDLRFDGEIENPCSLPWKEFQAMAHVRRTWDFHCVTTWSKLDVTWDGVPFSAVEALVRPRSSARHIVFECDGGYTTNIPLEVARRDDIIFADRLDGGPIPPEHGGPMRPVVPSLYGWKSAKWCRQVHFLAEDEPGYWEVRGYSNTADPWTEDRYS